MLLQIPTPKSKKREIWGIDFKRISKKTGLLERFVKVYLMVFCVLYTHFFRIFLEHCAIVRRSQRSQTKYTIVPFGMLKIICLSILDDITKKTKNLELVKGRYCSIQIHSKS